MKTNKGIFSHISTYILHLDVMGPKPELSYKRESRYRTSLGLLFTILAFTLSSMTIKFTWKSYANKTNADVFKNYNSNIDSLVLNTSSLPFYINLRTLDVANNAYNHLNITNIDPPNLIYFRQNSSGYYFLSDMISMIRCNKEQISEIYLSSQSDSSILSDFAFCLPSDKTFQLKTQIDTQDVLKVIFHTNSYLNLLKENMFFHFVIASKQIVLNPNNFTNYYNYVWKQQLLFPDESLISNYNLPIEDYNLIKDQTQFIFSDIINKTFVNFQSLATDFVVKKASEMPSQLDFFASVSLLQAEMYTETLIKYKSFGDVISEFGGTFNMLYSILSLFLSLIIDKFYSPSLINNVFSFHENLNEEITHLRELYKTKIIGKKNSLNYNSEGTNPKNNPINNSNININKSNDVLILRKKSLEIINFNKKFEQKRPSQDSESIIFEIQNKMKSKKKVEMTCADYSKKKLFSKCCKSHYTVKHKIFSICENYIKEFTDISFLPKMGLDILTLKDSLYPKNVRELLTFPSLNVTASNTLHMLKNLNFKVRENDICKIFTSLCKPENTQDKIQENLLRSMVNLDFKHRSNRRLLNNYLNNNF